MKQIIFLSLVLCTLTFSQNDPEPIPSVPENLLAVNPIFLPLGTIHIEYDRAIGGSKIILGTEAWLEYRNVESHWIHIKAMYFFSGNRFEGLSVGLTGGIHRSRSDEAGKLKEDTMPVAGGSLQYNWMLGSGDRFMIGTGFGAEAPLGKRAADSPIPAMNANVRIVAGWLF